MLGFGDSLVSRREGRTAAPLQSGGGRRRGRPGGTPLRVPRGRALGPLGAAPVPGGRARPPCCREPGGSRARGRHAGDARCGIPWRAG